MEYRTFLTYFLLIILTYINLSMSYFINIDAHGEECFHDKVSAGTRMALMFEVADGGFLDIDVKVSIMSNRLNRRNIIISETL